MAKNARKLTTTVTSYGSTVLDMPKSLDGLNDQQLRYTWNHFIGGVSAASLQLGSIRRTIRTTELLDLMERAAAFAREHVNHDGSYVSIEGRKEDGK